MALRHGRWEEVLARDRNELAVKDLAYVTAQQRYAQ